MKINKNIFGFIALLVILSTTSILSLNLYLKEKTAHDKIDIRSFPNIVGDWKGRDLEVKEFEYQILKTRNLISREYINSSTNERLYLFIIYSEADRSVFHPPEVCMIGSGIAIVDKQIEKINSGKRDFLTNKLYAEKNNFKELVLYSYKAGNLYTNNFYLQQLILALHQIFGKLVPGATIRVSMAIGNDERATLVILKDFLSKTVNIVDRITSV